MDIQISLHVHVPLHVPWFNDVKIVKQRKANHSEVKYCYTAGFQTYSMYNYLVKWLDRSYKSMKLVVNVPDEGFIFFDCSIHVLVVTVLLNRV